MTDTTIRIDTATAKLVAELAHLMERTKKDVLADAVAGYARARLPALADGRMRYGDLSPREQLTLRRDELLRRFEEQGTVNVRLLGSARAPGVDAVAVAVAREESIILLAETDIILGSEAESMMEEIAKEVLGFRVEVISATRLSLFAPERLARLVQESAPL
ncbi:hypothetical protein BJ978_001496 [Agromyces terreus]|uniref:Uncharacterized protein n=1 Tax=Agromyces terreus TaxID=424795 RepID=A0A9X2H1C0_9MICO|nr:hypothetical protein [Agromyces terreus]MCP2370820.1 hypothetical protein [Agromyces terreus]